MSFEDTPEYQQSLRMRDACNRVLCNVYGVNADAIERCTGSILDRNFAIDMRIRFGNGSQITGQEKALTYGFYRFRTFTIEFMQNRFTREKGEFFHIASQFYLHGYSDSTGIGFAEWYLLDIVKLIPIIASYSEWELSQHTLSAGRSNATFLVIEYDKLPPEVIIDHYRTK